MDNETEVVDSPQQTELNLADVSTDDLREALSTQTPEEAAQAVEAQPEEQSQEAQPETVTEEVSLEETEVSDGTESDAEVETEEERLSKRRIRPKNELDQQVIDLYRSQGFNGTFADASSVIYGQVAPPNQPQPQPQPQAAQQQPDTFTQEAGTLNAEIQQLEVKVKEAAEDLDTLEALNLQREIMKRELRLQNLHDQEKQQEVEYNTHRDRAVESRDHAYESYPDLSDKGTLYRKEFDHFVEQAQQSSDYAVIFQSPRWPEIMANDFAARKGQAPPAAEPQQQVEQRQVKPAMGNQAKVLTTGQTTQPVQQPLTQESVLNSMGTMSNQQLYELLGQPQ